MGQVKPILVVFIPQAVLVLHVDLLELKIFGLLVLVDCDVLEWSQYFYPKCSDGIAVGGGVTWRYHHRPIEYGLFSFTGARTVPTGVAEDFGAYSY